MASECVGLQRFLLKELAPEVSNALIVGIIIAKQRPRQLNTEGPGKAVWNFTVRDSPFDYINASYWGPLELVFRLNDKFQTGDVVEIVRPKVLIRRSSDSGERYRPSVTSPFTLVLGEQSQMLRHEADDVNGGFAKLLRLPTKPLSSFVILSNVQNYEHFKDELVDLLVSVRSVGEIRTVKTRTGLEQQVRDLVVFDHTNSGVKISLWDPELIVRAGLWKSRVTVLFITDVKIEWNAFHRCICAVLGQRTVITEDPAGPEAEALRSYARNAPLQATSILESLTDAIPDPMSIQNVMTARHVLDKAESIASSVNVVNPDDQKFTALVYAAVTQLDLDGQSRVVTNRCRRCKNVVNAITEACANAACPVASGDEPQDVETNFDLSMILSDHTGSLLSCRLTGRTAENVLNCTVHEFLTMSDPEKYQLKWKYLLERCAARLMVLCIPGRGPLISIVSCQLASPMEVANRLPHY